MVLAVRAPRKLAADGRGHLRAGDSGPAWLTTADALVRADAMVYATAKVEVAAVTRRAFALLAGLVRPAGVTAPAAIVLIVLRVDLASVRHGAVAVGKAGDAGVGA